MNKKLFYWILFVIIFGDLLAGGITSALTLDYWNSYMAFPISMIEGVGFTAGLTLIPLAIYVFFVYKLFLTAKSLGKKYIDYVVRGYSLVLILYAITFIGRFFVFAKLNVDRANIDEIVKANLVGFDKSVSVKDLRIEKIQGTYDSYKANFVINIPSKYIFNNQKTYLKINVDSMDTLSKIDTFLYYTNKEVVDVATNFNNRDPNEIKLVFNDSGDLDINVEYMFIRPNDKDDLMKDRINVNLKFAMPNKTNLCPINTCPIGNEWEYNTQIPISYY